MDLIVGALQFDFSIHAPCEESDAEAFLRSFIAFLFNPRSL